MDRTIGIMGAGAVGSYVGGRLLAAGRRAILVGRERGRGEIAAHGLTTVDLDGRTRALPASQVTYVTDVSALAACDTVLVCVKSGQTEETGRVLARILRPGTILVSMQNGVRNADRLKAASPESIVLRGIVGFNVLSRGSGVFRRATSGPLVVEASEDPRVAALERDLVAAGFEVERPRDVAGQQWSKLVMNLNNAVSALTDAPTGVILGDRSYRRIVAALIEEALAVFDAAGIRPARLGVIPVTFFPRLLRLPDWLFRPLARAQLKVDPEARSSMWEDLARGRRTEVDELNGEIVALAGAHGAAAPLNRRAVDLVRAAEAAGRGSPKLSADALWQALGA